MNNIITSLASPSDFELDGYTYIATGLGRPTLAAYRTAYEEYLYDSGKGATVPFMEVDRETRALVAELMDTDPDAIAFVGNVAGGVNLVTQALDLHAGDNIVVPASEYPSGLLPWLRYKQQGIEIRLLGAVEQNLAGLLSKIDSRTSLVFIDHADYLTGYLYDLATIRAETRAVGARLLVDASQTLGVVPVDVTQADAIFSTAYKWLLGPHGVAVLHWNRTTWPELAPTAVGWHNILEPVLLPIDPTYQFQLKETAQRFEIGGLPWPNIYLLRQALRYLANFPKEARYNHVQALGWQVIEGLKSLGIAVSTPEDPALRAGNICIPTPISEALVAQLDVHKIKVSNGHHRMRISPWIFNDSADIARILAALEILKGKGIRL